MKNNSNGTNGRAKSKYGSVQIRELPSFKFNPVREHPIPTEFVLFFEKRVLPTLHLSGYKVEEKRDLALSMVHALVMARKRGGCVADTRDCTQEGVRRRVELWNSIKAAGYLHLAIGSEKSGMVTRYLATKELMALRRSWKLNTLVDLDLERNTALDRATAHGLIYLHTGRVNPITGKPLHEKQQRKAIDFKHLCSDLGLDMLREREDAIEAFNDCTSSVVWRFKVTDPDTGRQRTSPLNPCVREIHVGQFHRAVRYYSWSCLSGQSLTKEERRTITCGGEPVAELDFSASILRMLYHLRGIDPAGDVYRPEAVFRQSYQDATQDERELLRELVKRATLVCLNVKTRRAAHSSVGKLLKEHPDRKLVWEIISKREQIDIKGIVRRIVKAHPALRPNENRSVDCFFGETGLEMMTVESKIMRVMMKKFTEARKPALMIHDAVVCRISDVKFTKRVMTEAWQYILSTDFKPAIKRAF